MQTTVTFFPVDNVLFMGNEAQFYYAFPLQTTRDLVCETADIL
jgi:hypothetical protein